MLALELGLGSSTLFFLLVCLRFPTVLVPSAFGLAPSRDMAASPLPRLTNTEGFWDAISNLCSAAFRATAFLLVLGLGEGRGWVAAGEGKTCWIVEEWPAVATEMGVGAPARVAVPSRARATGISSIDSAESEWYSAGGPAACMGARGGRVTLRGKAGNGRRWLKDEDRVAAATEESMAQDTQGHKVDKSQHTYTITHAQTTVQICVIVKALY